METGGRGLGGVSVAFGDTREGTVFRRLGGWLPGRLVETTGRGFGGGSGKFSPFVGVKFALGLLLRVLVLDAVGHVVGFDDLNVAFVLPQRILGSVLDGL